MDKQTRQVGIFLTVVGCIFFIAGVVTDHWARSGPLHYGLWSICRNLTSQIDSNSSQINASSLSSTISTISFQQEYTEREIEEKEEEEVCEGFSLSEISAAFHVVRALMVCAFAQLVYSTACGRLLRSNVRTEDTFLATHKAELVCLLAASTGLVAVSIFKSSFRSFEFNDHYEPELEWSQAMLQVGSILILIGASLMIAPKLKEKCVNWSRGQGSCHTVSVDDFKDNPFRACYHCLFCQQRQSPQSVEPDTDPAEIELHRYSFPPLNDSFTNIFTVDIRNSPLPSRYSPSLTIPLNPNSSCTEPAPRYEDLTPREAEEVPPPPSYDEAISGLYSITDTSTTASASTYTSPIPPAPVLMSESYLPPPPGYDETTA